MSPVRAEDFANQFARDAKGRKVVDLDPEKMFERNERQKAAFRAAMSGRWREIVFGGGMGGGKSYVLKEICKAKLLSHRGCTVLIVRDKLDQIRDQLFPMILESIPEEMIEQVRVHPKPLLKLKNGSRAVGLPGVDPEDFRSWNNVVAILVDEANLLAERMFPAMLGRFRVPLGSTVRPLLFMTTNPAAGYLDKEFARPAGGKPRAGRKFIKSLATDNGYIDRVRYEQDMRETRTEREFNRDFLGDWGAFRGLVFPEFNRNVHVKDFELPDRRKLRFVAGMDHAWNNPTVIAMGAVDEAGNYWIYDEIWRRGIRPWELAKLWKQKREKWGLGWEDSMVCGDTSLWSPDKNTGDTPARALTTGVMFEARRAGLPDPEDYSFRLVQANKSMDGNQTAALAMRAGRFWVHESNCPYIAKGLADGRFMDETPTEARHGVASERIHPEGKDCIDAVRYFVNNAREPAGPRPRTEFELLGRDQAIPAEWVLDGGEAARQRAREAIGAWEGLGGHGGRGWEGFYPEW